MPRKSSSGKPHLLFAPNDADKEWRLKEKIIALIESHLQGFDDLLTFSPAHPRNTAGDTVEVDAAFAHVRTPEDLFEFVEVRDRKGRQGRPWIEAVLGRRVALGIGKPIAVSAEGFTGPAARLARTQGIGLRTLLPETAEETQQWYTGMNLRFSISPKVSIQESHLVIDVNGSEEMFYGDTKKSVEPNIIVALKNQKVAVSLDGILSICLDRNPDFLHRVLSSWPEDNAVHNGHIDFDASRESFSIRADAATAEKFGIAKNQLLPVKKIGFFIKGSQGINDVPVEWRYCYEDSLLSKPLAQCVGGRATTGSTTWYGFLVRLIGDDGIFKVGGGLFQ